ncbi:MAG: ATP-dependent sacrificial sulfur transferase LarE [Candidatus Nezhaarchaeota archaeon]|nr:ATP-dependent sacrificial sulfur transferase LarE [Candidatus Nezhaarchaeota archaeon]MCX8141329.1 ATP-dependent sacrificial sulfur transferase LarE [Candidatus Nezhaarchaeota archaeon]MDW8049595.1 ATP-dependent sacrificial sulfur transferase LarE [Nitrososphaerota archaeon]
MRDLKSLIYELIVRLQEKGSVLVALSGGVDSSVVAFLANQALGVKALAVTIDSPLMPPGELEDAINIAKFIGIRHRVIELNELEVPGLSNNPRDRCYLCKKFRFRKLKELALEEGISVVADGTNRSDSFEYRPGLKAAIEEGVYSPLLEAGLTKNDVREIAKYLNLPFHDKPPNACLATRVPYGEKLTIERLKRIGLAEKIVKDHLGVKLVRVRDHGDLARIEVDLDYLRLFPSNELLKSITAKLKMLGFRFVTLDLEGYKSGCFDVLLNLEPQDPNLRR